MTLVATARVYAGNDVVDLAHAREREPLDRAWMERHMTAQERERFGVPSSVAFWSLFAAKEAAFKAFAQAGVGTPNGSFAMLEADLASSRVRHLASGETADLLHLTVNADCVHAVAWYSPAGELGGSETVLTGIGYVPETSEPSDYARERLIASIAARLPGVSATGLEIASRDGIPRVVRSGSWQDWSVSLSHSGRLAAWAWVVQDEDR